ncbi:uncharacterized protein [Epargyreus clarus]|uniref:uncharacterized protein isoform X1 n=1 Tax=Epargyreus clarus TaxID=520877 RepID=UPI003C2EA803
MFSHRTAMATDEEKFKLAKLLQGIEVPDVKISERGMSLVKEFQQKFGSEIETESMNDTEEYDNPYVPDKVLLEENERKLRELLAESKREKREEKDNVILSGTDPNRPWRTHSSKEKLLRIDGELKRHSEKGSQAMSPLAEDDMKELVEACRQETRAAPPVGADRLRDTVEEARKHLPNFQYRRIENTTATAICPDAHQQTAAPQTVVDEE